MNDHHLTIDDEQLKRLELSYGRCCLDDNFLDTFYDLFRASSPEVSTLFANTDMNLQRQMLKTSLAMLVMYVKGSEYASEVVTDLAERHSSRAMDIKPHLYKFWLESLIRAIERHDPGFSADLEVEWRQFLSVPIEFMKTMY